MDFIIDAITEWIKDFLIEAITGNLSNMFGDVNTKVATIAGEVGKTPEQWNSGVFSMIHSLSESVIVPIAGLVIAAVLSYELIRMVIDRNNMHDFDTFIFFKWIIKAGIAAYVVSHTFDFIIAIFEVAQTMVQQSAGVIDANASIDISSALASITTELEAKGLGELFALMLETWVVSFAMTVMGALITIILYGRMIEIYIYASVGPLPFATLANHEWGNIGTNYIRGLVALGLQGFLIMVITGIYAILVKSLSISYLNHRTNVDLNNRMVCYNISKLGQGLKKLVMSNVQKHIWQRTAVNRYAGITTRIFLDEFHLLLKEPQTAAYTAEIYKRFRKWNGIPTSLTQNVKDLLDSSEIENILENSDFVLMLNQGASDRNILAQRLGISPQELNHVTNSGEGEGLLFFGDKIIPFEDKFPRNTQLYRVMTTKPSDLAA